MKCKESEKLEKIIKDENAKRIVGNGVNVNGRGVLLLGSGKTTTSVLLVLLGECLVGDDYIAFWEKPSEGCYMCSFPGYACGPYLRDNIKEILERDEELDSLVNEMDTHDIRDFVGKEDAYLDVSPLDYAIFMLSEHPELPEYLDRETLTQAKRTVVEISPSNFIDLCSRFTPDEKNIFEFLIQVCKIKTLFTSVEGSGRNPLLKRAIT